MMISSKRALALAIVFGGFAAAPALAQYQSTPQSQPKASAEAAPAAAAEPTDEQGAAPGA